MISAVFSGTTQWNGMCVRHRSTLLLFIVIIIIKQVVVTLRCDRNSNSTMCKQWQTCIWICADVGVVAMDSNISRSRSMEIKRGRKEFAHSARHAQLLGYDLFFFCTRHKCFHWIPYQNESESKNMWYKYNYNYNRKFVYYCLLNWHFPLKFNW